MKLLGYYTEQGKLLSAKLLTGSALCYTRAAAGSGVTALSAAALEQERQSLPLSPIRRSGMTVTLPATLTEALAEEDYTLREVGVYARDEHGHEVLCRVYRLTEPLEVRAGGRLTVRFYLEETVSEAAEVTLEATGAGLVTESDLEARMGAPGGLAVLDGTGTVPPDLLPYTYGAEDLEAGVTALETGHLHFVYAE